MRSITRLLLCALVAGLLLSMTPLAAQETCRPPYPGRLLIGGEGQVRFTDGSPLNVRAEPGLSGALNGQLAEGSTFLVMEGPVCADNLYWWRVAAQQAAGWVAEGIAGEYLVEPLQPVFDAAPLLPPETVLVFQLADGSYAYTDPALNPVMPATPIPPLPAPLYSRPVGSMRSPDRSLIAWLYDRTVVEPSMANECQETEGCVGRVYALVITEADGSNPRALWEPVIGEYYPHLRLLGWREDSGAIWLKQLPWGVASAHYLPMGGGLYEVTVPVGDSAPVITRRSEDYLGTDAVISPDGRWLAEGSNRLVITDANGMTWDIQPETPIFSQFTWSPDSDQLIWIELPAESASLAPQSFVFWLAMPTARTAAPLAHLIPLPEASDLPMTGIWLDNDRLSFTYGGGVWLLDVRTGDVGVWVAALDGQRVTSLSGVLTGEGAN